MKIWIISRECAEIAEAGGVKNVTYSLCKEFSELGHDVTLFIPEYKCTSYNKIENLKKNSLYAEVSLCNRKETINYSLGTCVDGRFRTVFVTHTSYTEKEGVYTYTENEQKSNPDFVKGNGHKDALFLDILFQKAVCKYGTLISDEDIPQIVHCQDASTACLPAFMNELDVYSKVKYVVTIHNAGPAYHHSFSSLGEACWYTELPQSFLQNTLNNGKSEPFLISAESGAYLTTVSEKYAEELVDPVNNEQTEGLSSIFAERNIHIEGITNGIDYDRYNPNNTEDSGLPFSYNPENGDLTGKEKCREKFLSLTIKENLNQFKDISTYGYLNPENPEKLILLSYHGRVTDQKGISVLIKSIPAILSNFQESRFVIAGQGEVNLEYEIIALTKQFPGKIIYLRGYNKNIVRLATAISDFAVLPSFFEPCGLEDFIAQIFGTLPVAHKTGGLTKISDYKTGFLYSCNTPESLIAKLSEVISIKKYSNDIINGMIINAAKEVHDVYYWKKVILNKYIPFFNKILKSF